MLFSNTIFLLFSGISESVFLGEGPGIVATQQTQGSALLAFQNSTATDWQNATTVRPQNLTDQRFGQVPVRQNFIAATEALERLDPPIEGPLQCSKQNPCLDGSCCNSSGKCGYKKQHCRPDPPAQCYHNCDAKAMCGVDSLGGLMRCGLNLCCSYYGWCGTEQIHCGNADEKGQTAPCQQGYGGCEIVAPKKCGTQSGTATRRKVAYYQSWNVRKRRCNTISPSQIDTKGLTHLYFAFASINPRTYQIEPAHPADEAMYSEFTALKTKTKGLQTWIAIGGFDFSDPNTPTHRTWSEMVSSPSRRAGFIISIYAFIQKYGFDGVDLDWEYPMSPERGGTLEDPQNLVALVKEIRQLFGTKYGLSSILAPDYWYLRGMDPKAMEPYVDMFGFMAYDLHGSWDSKISTLGALIRPHTDTREITKDATPLWFARLDPAKINFGLAYYGRGYTVADPKCMYFGCKFEGPSKATGCTNSEGVMSNREIRKLIEEKNLRPELIPDAMVKQVTWDDQWMGYDDEETVAMKIGLANDLCMGGTMIWAIDYDSGEGSGETPRGGDVSEGFGFIHLDPSMWKESKPSFSCEAPCNVVLPARPLPAPTTISIAGAATRTYIIPGVANGAKVTKTIITTVSYPPVTTSQVSLWPMGVASGKGDVQTLTAHASIDVAPVAVTLDLGTTTPAHTRNATVIGGTWYVTKTLTPRPSQTDHGIVFPVWWHKGTPAPLCKGKECGCVGRRCGKGPKTNLDIGHDLPCLNPLGCDKNGLPCLKPLGCGRLPCLNPFGCTPGGCVSPPCSVTGAAGGGGNSDNDTEEDDEDDEEEEEEECKLFDDDPPWPRHPDFIDSNQIPLNSPGRPGSSANSINGAAGSKPTNKPNSGTRGPNDLPRPNPPPKSPSPQPTISPPQPLPNQPPPNQSPSPRITTSPPQPLPNQPPPSQPPKDGGKGDGNGFIGKNPGGGNGEGFIGKTPGGGNGDGFIGKTPGGGNGDGFIGKNPGGSKGDGFIGKNPGRGKGEGFIGKNPGW